MKLCQSLVLLIVTCIIFHLPYSCFFLSRLIQIITLMIANKTAHIGKENRHFFHFMSLYVDWFGLIAYQPLFNAKSSLYIYFRNMICKHFVDNIFKQTRANFFCTFKRFYKQLNDQAVLFLTIQFSIILLFAHSLNIKQFYLIHWKDPNRCDYSGSECTWEQW